MNADPDAPAHATVATVHIDRDRCMGSGNCAYWAPATFDTDEEGYAILIGDPAAEVDRVELAAENCPTGAISFNTP